jgi:cell pole-organizing protein PopZ
MTKENTKSLLEKIKKKMTEINTPKTTDSQLNFTNLDDEFEYIVPKKTDSATATVAEAQKPKIALDAKTSEQIKLALSNQVNTQQVPSPQSIFGDEKDLAEEFSTAQKVESKLPDLSLAKDLRADIAAEQQKNAMLAATKESGAVTDNKTVNLNSFNELDLEGLGDVEDDMDFDIETEKKSTQDDKLVADSTPAQLNSMANIAPDDQINDKANEDAVKDDLDLDLDFDLDEDEDDHQQIAQKNSEEDLDLGDLENLDDDLDLDLKEKHDEAPVKENNTFIEASKDSITDKEIIADDSNNLDFGQEDEDEDLKLDIDSDKLDLEEGKKDDDHFDQLAKNNAVMNDSGDIKLNLENEPEGFQEGFLDHNKTMPDLSSKDSLDNLGDDLTFDQEDQLSDFNQEEQQNSSQNRPNRLIRDNLLSKQTIEKTSNSIKNLMNNFSKKPSSDKNLDSLQTTTVEQMMMSMLQPKLEEWLNANLPGLVEKIIREEISKIIPKN